MHTTQSIVLQIMIPFNLSATDETGFELEILTMPENKTLPYTSAVLQSYIT